MTSFHPLLEPYGVHHIPVSGGHTLYVEEYGNPKGIPVIFLHGGPGAGFTSEARKFFNPQKFRVIFFDQRGCNRSTPIGNLENNKAQNILGDIEHLRQFFSIEKWHIFGGSWGSTLALLYGIKHPERCLSLILRGIFLATQAETNWYFYGVKHFYPELSAALNEGLSASEKENVMETYYERIIHGDEKVSLKAIDQFLRYESCFSALLPKQHDFTLDAKTKAFMRIVIHYFQYAFFIEEDVIIKNCAPLKDIPIDIVQGRYDTVCPPISAYRLHQALPHSTLYMIDDAGHSSFEPGVALKLTELMDTKI